MNDPLFVRYMRAYMDLDVTPQLAPVPGIDLTDYKNTLVARFSNQAIADQLERCARTARRSFPSSPFRRSIA
jgi:mannitol 2-dehydrogenase